MKPLQDLLGYTLYYVNLSDSENRMELRIDGKKQPIPLAQHNNVV
jgi:hypothetical protein